MNESEIIIAMSCMRITFTLDRTRRVSTKKAGNCKFDKDGKMKGRDRKSQEIRSTTIWVERVE